MNNQKEVTQKTAPQYTKTDLSGKDYDVHQFHYREALERARFTADQHHLSDDDISAADEKLAAHDQSLVNALMADGAAAKHLRAAYDTTRAASTFNIGNGRHR